VYSSLTALVRHTYAVQELIYAVPPTVVVLLLFSRTAIGVKSLGTLKCTAFFLFPSSSTHLIQWSLLNLPHALWLPQDFMKRGANRIASQSSSSADVSRVSALENCRDFTIQGGTFNVSTTMDQSQGGEIPSILSY
jgi:hypothetical protein